MNAERFCNTYQGFNGNDFFSTFDLTKIFWVEG